MPRPKRDMAQIVMRVPREWLARADRVVQRHAKSGLLLTRTDAFRMAMTSGFEVLEFVAERKAKGK